MSKKNTHTHFEQNGEPVCKMLDYLILATRKISQLFVVLFVAKLYSQTCYKEKKLEKNETVASKTKIQ